MKTAILTLGALVLSAASGFGETGSVRRHVLALYNSELGQTPTDNLVHENAEMVLNHLGCIVDYWDLAQGLPDQVSMQKYRGVLAWFHGRYTRTPEDYFAWATEQIRAGKKYVVMGDIGDFGQYGPENEALRKRFEAFCAQLGLRFGGNWTDDVTKIQLVYKDPEMVEFERDLTYETNYYIAIQSTRPDNRVYLRLRRSDVPNSESDLVVTTANGGFAPTSYVYYQDPRTFRRAWRLNPFRFFEEVFDLAQIPRPDVTTLNGLRIWCSHIDGDALISESRVKPGAICGEVIRDEILRKYRWPVSVSVVVAEVEKEAKFAEIARSIYQLPWVEAASHSYSHPFYWADDYAGKDEYPYRHLPVPGYQFNLETEIVGSIRYINETLLPPGKKVQQMFWTGNCEPTPESLRLCEQINVGNINGGDTVFDRVHASYTYVAPLSAVVGGYRQIYAPHANENIYTQDWQGPYYGFHFVLQSFKNTESPIRVKPIDVYYHFYIGERWASLNSLKSVLQETTAQDVAPMFISQYLAMVEGFFSAEIEKMGNAGWRITNFGAATTLRFDHEPRFVDLTRSEGVLGFTHFQDALYVHLQPRSEARVVLTTQAPEAVYLARGSHRIRNWQASEKRVTFDTDGWGKGLFELVNLLANRTYRVSIHPSEGKRGGSANRFLLNSDSVGKLALQYLMEGAITVRIELTK